MKGYIAKIIVFTLVGTLIVGGIISLSMWIYDCETNYTEITSIKRIVDSYKIVLKENEELKSKLENKDKYFELITGLGYDYDGYYNRETGNGNIKDLADLIDELVQATRDGLNDMSYQK